MLNIVAFLSVHMVKSFSSFNDVYIYDLQEKINNISKQNDGSRVYVFEKESDRLLNNTPFSKEHPELKPISDNFDLTEFYVKNSFFPGSLYYINGEKENRKTSGNFKKKHDKWGKIFNCYSNEDHTHTVSIYRHQPYTPSPDISLSSLGGGFILKAYVYEYDAFIYQAKDKIVWVVGKELDDKTEIIYHIYTTNPDLLPENRKKWGNDNRGIIAGKVPKETIGKYSIYKKDIPTEYPVLRIRSGFNISSKITWTRSFTVSE